MYNYNPYLQNYQQNYQPNYQNNFQQQQQNTSPAQDERIWVQNETSAEAYLLAPGGFARLWDSGKNRFYEKRADATGRPLPMDIYEYKRVMPQTEPTDTQGNKLSYDEINERFDAITQRIDALEKVKKGVTKNAKQSDADDTNV